MGFEIKFEGFDAICDIFEFDCVSEIMNFQIPEGSPLTKQMAQIYTIVGCIVPIL